MQDVALPKRIGPSHGSFAFSEEGERQIYDAVKQGVRKERIAFECETSVVTINAILKRVQARIDSVSGNLPPEPDKQGGNGDEPEDRTLATDSVADAAGKAA